MENFLQKFKFIILGLLVSIVFISCAGSKKVAERKKETTSKIEKNDKLEGEGPKKKINKIMVYLGGEDVIKWKLTSLNNQNASGLYNDLPMMRFDEPWKQIYGTTGCNKFTAYYERNTDILSVSRITSTDLECDNNNELKFLDTLKGVDQISEEGNTLTLLSGGQVVLVFERF